MRWWRPCAAAARPPDRAFAETGDCFEGLEIVVDVRRETVVSIERRPGPGG